MSDARSRRAAPGARLSGFSPVPLWLLAFAVSLAACCRRAPTQSWVGDGGVLGHRVRGGKLPGLTHHRFRSRVLRQDVGVVVVIPPGYQARPERRYPAVYVFPGFRGDEWAYPLAVGLDSTTVQTLFSDPDTAPILVWANPGNSGGHAQAERVLAEELVSFVDRTYRTRAQASGRSLEGFSLGGVTALMLLTRRPDVFGRAVGLSSACYPIGTCGVLRESLRARAREARPGSVMLSVGAKENADNRGVNDELAPLFGVPLLVLPDLDHDWPAQLATPVGEHPLGKRIADFHLAGFAR
jgi:pimeloyl-ACP methyl ester carboxylesterase